MALPTTSLLLLLCGGCTTAFTLPGYRLGRAQDDGGQEAVVANVSALTDEVLKGLRDYIPAQGLDKVQMPDVQQEFNFTAFFILTVYGELQMTNGTMSNLQKINRHEDTQVVYLNKELIITAAVELEEIATEYEFWARVGLVHRQGSIRASVSGLRVQTMLKLNLDSIKASVIDFKVTDMGSINVKIQNGFLGMIASLFTNLVAYIMKKDLARKLTEEVPQQLQKVLDSLDLASFLRPPPNLT